MTVRIGVLGCAAIAGRSMLPAFAADPACAVTAVASRTPERAAGFAARFGAAAVTGYDALLERDDVDAVYVPLPTGLHHRWVRAALRAGKHVIAEKSLTDRLAHTEEVVAIARSAGLALMENFMFLTHRQHGQIDALLAGGAIGDVRGFSAEFAIPPRAADDIRYRTELGGGALLDTGAYTVRCARRFLGADLEVAGAFGGFDAATAVDLRGAALLVAPSGVPAQLAWGLDHAYRCSYTLAGTRGYLRLDRAFTTPADLAPRVLLERDGTTLVHALDPDDHFAGTVARFAALVTGTGDREAEYVECLAQARTLDAIRRAAVQSSCPALHP